jgi:hypothetical protein
VARAIPQQCGKLLAAFGIGLAGAIGEVHEAAGDRAQARDRAPEARQQFGKAEFAVGGAAGDLQDHVGTGAWRAPEMATQRLSWFTNRTVKM